jgi:sec-independent protein translocase protein TatA
MYFGFFNLGPVELIAIMLVVLLIFGPKKLPQIGRSFGEMLSNFRKGTGSDKDENDQPDVKESDK